MAERGVSFNALALSMARVEDVQGEIRGMRSWMFVMYGPIVAGVVAVLAPCAEPVWLAG